MKDREQGDTLVDTIRTMLKEIRSEQSREDQKMVMREFYIRFVHVPLAFVLHPIAMTRVGLLIGSKESQEKDWETLRRVPQPSFLRGGQRLK